MNDANWERLREVSRRERMGAPPRAIRPPLPFPEWAKANLPPSVTSWMTECLTTFLFASIVVAVFAVIWTNAPWLIVLAIAIVIMAGIAWLLSFVPALGVGIWLAAVIGAGIVFAHLVIGEFGL